MLSRRSLTMLVAGATLAFMSPADAGGLKIHGSTTVFANLFADHQASVEAESGQQLTVVSNGSSRGINDLTSGAADMGMISASLEVTIAKIQKKNAGFDGSDLVGHNIGEAQVAFIVNPGNPVKSVSDEQIAAILSGDIKNWGELGGQPMPIKVVMETSGGGVRSMTEKAYLDGGSVAADAVEVPNATQIAQIVSQMPMAFGIAAKATTKGVPVAILEGHAAPAQPLVLVTKGEATAEQKAVIQSARAILK